LNIEVESWTLVPDRALIISPLLAFCLYFELQVEVTLAEHRRDCAPDRPGKSEVFL
jgi:hypothetical protein